jgi:peptidoglycan/xylan/chitin deacetylase (PgdA/CDA1 family)
MKTKVGLIFDDGFARSTLRTAEIFESFGLRAVFAVLADPRNFVEGCGDWAMWNELQRRGHIIQPHGLTHAKLTELSPADALDHVRQCLDSFSDHLEGFDPKQAIYAFTYNTPTRETVEWLLPRVRAVRVGGDPLLSEQDLASRVWRSQTDGPGDPYGNCAHYLNLAARKRPAAMFYCLHGLDGEYWGATSADNLRRILERIITDEAFEYWAAQFFAGGVRLNGSSL